MMEVDMLELDIDVAIVLLDVDEVTTPVLDFELVT